MVDFSDSEKGFVFVLDLREYVFALLVDRKSVV